MPPKKAETPAVTELPDQPPSFDSDAYMTELLQRAKARDVAALETGVAAALNLSDFRTNLRRGIVVDFVVEAILFASQQGFAARKTAAFLRWVNEMRRSIETTGAVDGARALFKDHLVAHAERSSRDAGSSDASSPLPLLTDDGVAAGGGVAAPTPPAPNTTQPAGAAPSKPPASKRDTGKKAAMAAAAAAKGAPDDSAQGRSAADTGVVLSVSDMGQVAEFVVTGLLQHWQLYHYAATAHDPPADTASFTLTVQTPMRPPPLARALTQEQHDAQVEDERARAEEEMHRQQEAERVALEEQRRCAEEAAAAEKQRLEEEAANALYFEKVGTERAVERVQSEVEAALRQRQQAIAARIAALEQQLALAPA